jgi:hypothetical protein
MLAGGRGVVRPRRAHRRCRRAGRSRLGLERVGLLREPRELGLAAYDADDIDVLRSFADLSGLGVPDHVLFELARILNDGIESMQRQTPRSFMASRVPTGVRESASSSSQNRSTSPSVVRDMRTIADYVQHRNIQRIVLRELGEPYTEDEADC